MSVREVSLEEFRPLLQYAATAYDTEAFISLNARKAVGGVHYLIIDSDETTVAGLVVGEDAQGRWHGPFSAPFADFYWPKKPNVGLVYDVLRQLRDCGHDITLTLPPEIYGQQSGLAMALATGLGMKVVCDLNYHLWLPDWTLAGKDTASARNKYNHAVRQGLRYVPLDANNAADVARAYEVIRINREAHGYPLRMTLDDVLATRQRLQGVFAVVTDADGHDVAAAQVWMVTPEIAQVIYWGDNPAYSHLRPMNFLAPELTRHLPEGTCVLDLGPASTDGQPNIGLCDFKASLGARLTLKPSVSL